MAQANTKNMKVKTKAMDDDSDMGADAGAPPIGDVTDPAVAEVAEDENDSTPVDLDGDGDADAAVDDDGDMTEPLGAQVLRRMYEHASILMEEYDEMMGVLENPKVKDHLQGLLEDIEQLMSDTEEVWGDEYPDLPPLQDTAEDTTDAGSDDGGTDTVPADSEGELEPPTGDEVVEGMQTKALRAKYKAAPAVTKTAPAVKTKTATGTKTKMCKGCKDEMDVKGVTPGDEAATQSKPGTEDTADTLPSDPGSEAMQQEMETKAAGGACECQDPGCPVCQGHCTGIADSTVINSHDPELPEIAMCAGCAEDALAHGFSKKDMQGEIGPDGEPMPQDATQMDDAVMANPQVGETDVYAAVDNAGMKAGEVTAKDETKALAKAQKRWGKDIQVKHLGRCLLMPVKHFSAPQADTVRQAADYFKQLEVAPNVTYDLRNKSGGWHKEIDQLDEDNRKGMEAGSGWTVAELKRLGAAAAYLKELGSNDYLSAAQKSEAVRLSKDLGLLGIKAADEDDKEDDKKPWEKKDADGNSDDNAPDSDVEMDTKALLEASKQQQASMDAMLKQLAALK